LENRAIPNIKRRVSETKALAASKVGHFFFTLRSGAAMTTRCLTAIHVLEMLNRNPDNRWAQLYADLRRPGARPHVAALRRRGQIRRRGEVTARFQACRRKVFPFSAARSAISLP